MKIPTDPWILVQLVLAVQFLRSLVKLIKEWYALPESFRAQIGSRMARAGLSFRRAILESWQARGKPSPRRVRIATWVYIVSGPVFVSAWFYFYCGLVAVLAVTRPVGGVRQFIAALLAIGFYYAAEWYRGDARRQRTELQQLAQA